MFGDDEAFYLILNTLDQFKSFLTGFGEGSADDGGGGSGRGGGISGKTKQNLQTQISRYQ